MGTEPHPRLFAKSSKRSAPLKMDSLGKLSREDAEKFIHHVISEVCEKQGPRYEDNAKLLSLSEFSSLRQSLMDTVRAVSRIELKSKSELVERINGRGFTPDLSQLIGECVWVRREEMRGQLLRDSSAISCSHLRDFDWKLKLVMSSDKLGSIQKPVLSLDLDLEEEGERRREGVEMSKEELGRLIASLETANKVVSQLRT